LSVVKLIVNNYYLGHAIMGENFHTITFRLKINFVQIYFTVMPQRNSTNVSFLNY